MNAIHAISKPGRTPSARPRWLLGLFAAAWLGACGGAQPTGPLVVSLVGEPVVFSDVLPCFTAAHNGGDGARLTWDFGDGSPPAVGGEGRVCHAYATLGRHLLAVTLQARGQIAGAQLALHVVRRPLSPAPVCAQSLAYDAERAEVWVTNSDAGTVSVVSVAPGSAPRLVAELPACDRPRSVALAGASAVVVCHGDGQVMTYDRASRRARPDAVMLPASSRPFGVVADPRGGGRVFVTLQDSGLLAVIELGRQSVIAQIDVGFDARGLAMRSDGLLVVSAWRADQDGTRLTVVDAADPELPRVVQRLRVPPQVKTDGAHESSGVLGFVSQAVFSPDGRTVLAPGLRANVVSGRRRNGVALLPDTTARAALVAFDPDRAAAEAVAGATHVAFDGFDYVRAAAFSPSGDRLFLAMFGSEQVLVVEPFSYGETVGSFADVGHGVEGLVVSPDGGRLFVHAALSRMLRVYEVRELSPAAVPQDVVTVATEPLAPAVLRGKLLFNRSADPRMGRQRYLSCASCHMDGEGDNLVWDFTQRGEGLRNTSTLAGLGATAGLLHWSGSFDEVQDLEGEVRNQQGGTGFLDDAGWAAGTHSQPLGEPVAGLSADLDALAAYVASLRSSDGFSPERHYDDTAWTLTRQRGLALFTSAEVGCASCHAGSSFTDSGRDESGAPRLHDVGTLGEASGQRLGGPLTGLDTPTLRGLWRTAPYLHDGSAPTLREVLRTRNTGDRHGKTSQLSETELEELLTYVRTLDDFEGVGR